MAIKMCDGTETIKYITPITEELVLCRINWIDEVKKRFGVTYFGNKAYSGGHNILYFGDQGKRFCL